MSGRKSSRRPKSSVPGPSRKRLAKVIRAFLKRTGMKPTPFGIHAANDDKLLQRIETAAYGISMDKADEVMKFIENYEADIARAESVGIKVPLMGAQAKRRVKDRNGAT